MERNRKQFHDVNRLGADNEEIGNIHHNEAHHYAQNHMLPEEGPVYVWDGTRTILLDESRHVQHMAPHHMIIPRGEPTQVEYKYNAAYEDDEYAQYGQEQQQHQPAKRYFRATPSVEQHEMIGGGETEDEEILEPEDHESQEEEDNGDIVADDAGEGTSGQIDPSGMAYEEDFVESQSVWTSLPQRKRPATVMQCQVCGAVLRHPSKIKAHMRTHTGERPFVCNYCGKSFTQRTPWRMHEKRHTNDLPYRCPYADCAKAFPSASQLTAHELRHSGRKRMGPPRPHLKPKKKKVAPADYPEDIDAIFDDLRGPPIVEAQIFDAPPQPPMSAAASKKLDDVINAVAAGLPVDRTRGDGSSGDGTDGEGKKKKLNRAPPIVAQCQICGIMLKHPSKIQAHMRSHNGQKLWRCGECGLEVATLYALRMHIRRKHEEGLRPFLCSWDECPRRFVNVSAKNEHERIVHGGVKRYECTIGACRRLFSRRYHLTQHRQRYHPHLALLDDFDDDSQVVGEIDYLENTMHHPLQSRPMEEKPVEYAADDDSADLNDDIYSSTAIAASPPVQDHSPRPPPRKQPTVIPKRSLPKERPRSNNQPVFMYQDPQ